jgi:hypothetical protein
MRSRFPWILFLFLALASAPVTFSQRPWPHPRRDAAPIELGGEPKEREEQRAAELHQREQESNQRRQEEIRRDADKLLQFATELKQRTDRADENLVSLDMIRRAERIEKLAKSLKQKMKGGM